MKKSLYLQIQQKKEAIGMRGIVSLMSFQMAATHIVSIPNLHGVSHNYG